MSLTDYIGCIDNEKICKKSNSAIKKTFGLWLYNLERTGDIRCLCPKCLKGYLDNLNYIVKRLDPFASARDKCDECNEMRWDYIIYDRSTALDEKGCSNE